MRLEGLYSYSRSSCCLLAQRGRRKFLFMGHRTPFSCLATILLISSISGDTGFSHFFEEDVPKRFEHDTLLSMKRFPQKISARIEIAVPLFSKYLLRPRPRQTRIKMGRIKRATNCPSRFVRFQLRPNQQTCQIAVCVPTAGNAAWEFLRAADSLSFGQGARCQTAAKCKDSFPLGLKNAAHFHARCGFRRFLP